MQDLHEAQIRQIAINARRGASTRLLDGVGGKLKRNAPRRSDPLPNPLREFQVVPIARGQVRPRLRNANDGLAGHQLFASHPVVEIALDVQRHHARVLFAPEPVRGA